MCKSIVYVRASGIYDDSRATKEIMAFLECGYKVIVIGWDKRGGSEEKCLNVLGSNDIDLNLYKCRIDGNIGYKRIHKLLGFFRYVYKKLNDYKDILDVIHACDFDSGFPAYYFCKRNNTPLVYDIYDYYIDTHYIPSLLVDFVEKLEIKIINYANTTIICNEERREQISKSKPKNLVVIHNSPEIDELVNSECVYDYTYCGVMSDMRLLKEIIKDYPEEKGIKMLFAGTGSISDYIENHVSKYNNIDYIPGLAYSSVIEFEKKSKVLSAIYEPTIRNHRLCAPNKFYEALALGKPVIVCIDTGIDKIVKKYNLGIVIDYNSAQFYQALELLLKNDNLRMEMGKRSRQLYEEKYRWSYMKEKLINIYKEGNF